MPRESMGVQRVDLIMRNGTSVTAQGPAATSVVATLQRAVNTALEGFIRIDDGQVGDTQRVMYIRTEAIDIATATYGPLVDANGNPIESNFEVRCQDNFGCNITQRIGGGGQTNG